MCLMTGRNAINFGTGARLTGLDPCRLHWRDWGHWCAFLLSPSREARVRRHPESLRTEAALLTIPVSGERFLDRRTGCQRWFGRKVWEVTVHAVGNIAETLIVCPGCKGRLLINWRTSVIRISSASSDFSPVAIDRHCLLRRKQKPRQVPCGKLVRPLRRRLPGG